MRPVNLLPPRYRRARASGERQGIGYFAIGALAVLLLMVVMYVLTNNKINDAKEAAAQAQVEAAQAQARAGQLTAFGDFARLRASRQSAVAQLAEVRFDWERLMREVALVLPRDVHLTAFSGNAGGEAAEGGGTGGPTATMSGCAPDHPRVATTVVRLRKMHNVVSVDLASSVQADQAQASATGSSCPTAWSGTIVFQPESAATQPAPVPARLGGGQ